ncbi:MAG: NADH-quinone oxidoreductase subunit J [Bdellovibrio sp.]
MILPTTALALAVLVIVAKHPVHSLLSLINVFFITVLLYLSVNAEFLAFIFLIVYVGAIAILFLFVIMLLNVKELISAPRQKFEFTQLVALHLVGPFSLIISFKLINALSMFLQKSDILSFSTEQTSINAVVNYVNYQFIDIKLFSSLLYTNYSSAFMCTALLLLTAMLGAIILASSATDTEELITPNTLYTTTPTRSQNV